MTENQLTSSKSWRLLRREIGEKNATTTTDEVATGGASGDFFDIKRPRLKYPQELENPQHPVVYAWDDPYAHLGRIGYRRNTYHFKGPNKDDLNIYGGQHMRKTYWLEEMRRRIHAEEFGISAEVDDYSIAGTGEANAVKSREPRNKYYNRPGYSREDQKATWTRPTSASQTSLVTRFSNIKI